MQTLFQNPEMGYLVIGTIAAALMAFLRCLRFDRRDFVMVVTESIMCAMIAASIVMGVRSMWHIATVWAVPIGVAVGFIGTTFIHAVIKRLIEFQVGRFTGGQASDITKDKDNKRNS